jgi:peptidoglycan-N-acetylglucosamine deacetylase
MSSYSLYQPAPRFQWPHANKCCVMVCFDVDGETTALSADPDLKNRLTTYSQTTYGPSIGVPRLLGLLKHLQVPATFFVPGFIAEHHPRMVDAIVADGHEVGLHGYLHEKLITLKQEQEEEILERCIQILSRITGQRPIGYRAPWFELNPWTPDLLLKYEVQYCASMMGDDVPYTHPNGLIEIPGQWMLEDWEQFAFNADPAWGFIPENCEKVFDLWWQEFAAMYDYGCCFVLTLHPWLSGRPSRVRLLERLVRSIQQKERVWFASGRQIAAYFQKNPGARSDIDFDREESRRKPPQTISSVS